MPERDKQDDLDTNRVIVAAGETLTTNQGLGVADNQNSLRAGARGPTLLEDFILREKITSFDHERIPERAVHARGSAAHGYFQVYAPQTALSCAAFLNDPTERTPAFVRFSTVAGSRGSADTVRDARGFAVKLYTSEGIFDLVGNNIPVFFIQDAIKFPDLVHAVKPEPDSEMPQAGSAHDTFWDFIWLTPEATHMVMWVMSDRALPRSFRMMEGFGVNTFRLVNDDGEARFVKFHWKPLLGVHSLVWDEAQKINGKDSDFHRRDLWDAIEQGIFPEWELGIQVIEASDELAFDFDPLDATKIWPQDEVPLQRIGKLVLNRNPDNFFAETEQVAFCPSNVVRGIDFSHDPLLMGRLFSYLDTQITRLGGPNFAELPINRPTCPMRSTQRDGHMRHAVHVGKVSYQPSSLPGGLQEAQPDEAFRTHPEPLAGAKVRARSESFKDHFSQATLFWDSMSAPEQDHIVQAFSFELSKVMTAHVRERMVDILLQVDVGLATQVASNVGVTTDRDAVAADGRLRAGWAQFGCTSVPNPDRYAGPPRRAAELSMAGTIKDTVKTRKVAILVADGVDSRQVEAVRAPLVAAGAVVDVVGATLLPLLGEGGQQIIPTKTFWNTASVLYDAVYVPGGARGTAWLRMHGDALGFVQEAYRHYKTIGASGTGVDVLISSRIGRDEAAIGALPGVVAERQPASITALTQRFIAAVAQHRHFGRTNVDRVPA